MSTGLTCTRCQGTKPTCNNCYTRDKNFINNELSTLRNQILELEAQMRELQIQIQIQNQNQERPVVVKPEYQQAAASIICSICTSIMIDPVLTETGQSYCRKCITNWLTTHDTCPLTNQTISKTVVPNIALRNTIESITDKDKNKI